MSALDLPKGGRRYLQVAQLLADRIAAGEYPVGQKLPPERDLALTLDVSRTTVREALLALEIMRYIEIRVGSGVFVLSEHLRDRERGELSVANDTGPYEVLEARRVIEGQSAYLAAQRATDAQLGEIGTALARMTDAVDDIAKFDAADAEYHALIAHAAGNSVLETYVGHLWHMRNSALWQRWYGQTRNTENRHRSISDHRTIYNAMLRRRPEAAQVAMQLHIDVLTNRLLDLNISPDTDHPRTDK